MSQKAMNAFVTETYTPNGSDEEKTQYHRVGVAFPHRKGGGINLEIASGIAVSGRVVLFPQEEKGN